MHLRGNKATVWLPDHFVKRQKFTLFEKIVLNKHIGACYQSGLSLYIKYLNSFANEILMNNAVKKRYNNFDPVSYNWHNDFFKRHPGVKTKFSKPMEKVRVLNENADTYIEYFERYDRLYTK